MLALAAALRPAPAWRGGRLEPPAAVVGLPLVVFAVQAAVWAAWVGGSAGIGANTTGYWLAAATALVVTNRRSAFAVAVAVAVIAHLTLPRLSSGHVIFAARSFFGVHRVIESADGTTHRLTHGTTLHGWERLGTGRCAAEPATTIPMAQSDSCSGVGTSAAARSRGVIGLGAGEIGCYAPPGGRWTFLEIDPLVERIARDPALFTVLRRCRRHRSRRHRRRPNRTGRDPRRRLARHGGDRRLQLRCRAGAPADARVRAARARAGPPRRTRRVPPLEPLSGTGAGGRRRGRETWAPVPSSRPTTRRVPTRRGRNGWWWRASGR